MVCRVFRLTRRRVLPLLAAAFAAWAIAGTPTPSAAAEDSDTFSPEEILKAAENVFGEASKGLADVVDKIFAEQGRPNAYIAGEEISGAFVVGLRYGKGELTIKGQPASPIYWQGPSVGFDFGGNASKAFVLIYHLKNKAELYQRFPGIEGSFYFIAGLGVNYQASGDITLAPIRTGVGLRQGGNIGYLQYGPEHSWLPF